MKIEEPTLVVYHEESVLLFKRVILVCIMVK